MNEGCESYECYVCLQECDTKSPCSCNAYVHYECLVEIGKTYCTICKDEYVVEEYVLEIEEEKKERKCICAVRKCLAFIFLSVLSFIVSIIALGGCCSYINLILFICSYFIISAMYAMSIRRRN